MPKQEPDVFTPPEEDFYDRFARLWRKRPDLKAADIAKAAGLDNPGTISNWRKGGRIPGAEAIFGIAALFKVPAEWLLKGDAALPTIQQVAEADPRKAKGRKRKSG